MHTDSLPSADLPVPRTIASALTAGIRTDIVEGRWPPDAKLRVKELCERYQAGAIPIREALSRLATSGFVVAEDQRGFRVAGVSAEELRDITEMRVHVECEAVRRAVRQGGLDWEERLIGAHHRLSRLAVTGAAGGGIAPDWEQAHVAFHAALISACRSKWFISLSEILREQTARYRHLSVAASARTQGARAEAPRDLTSEHRRMLDAALARDAEQAAALLAEHIRATARLVVGGPAAGDASGPQPARC